MKLTTIRSAIRIPSSILSTPKRLYVASFVVAFALFGTVVLLAVMAASNSEFTVNPLKGTLSGNVAIVQNKSAIKGQAVQFGSGSTGTGSGGSTTGSGGSVGSSSGNSSGSNNPLAGANYAGSLILNDTGSQLSSWNDTSNFCSENSWEIPDGQVSKSGSNLNLSTTGKTGSCVAIKSPRAYASGVIQAYIDFPADPGKPNTIADWTSLWMTNESAWPTNGELDAVEAEPATGVNAVAWHWGSTSSPQAASTDGFFPITLPKDGPNLTPGWHTVDIVYNKGFFEIYYDGKEFTSFKSNVITGDALNIILSTSVTPNTAQIQQQLGNSPQNSDSSPATIKLGYLKIWSYK